MFNIFNGHTEFSRHRHIQIATTKIKGQPRIPIDSNVFTTLYRTAVVLTRYLRVRLKFFLMRFQNTVNTAMATGIMALV